MNIPAKSGAPSARLVTPDLAARHPKAARNASATRKARKGSAAGSVKAGTDWPEAGRKAYRTRLRNAAAGGDRDAAAKLAALRD